MHNEAATQHHAESHHDMDVIDVYGFWIYIMTDCVLFGCLFAGFIVLNNPHSYGPHLKHYLNLYDVLMETFFLLASNFTFCLAVLNLKHDRLRELQFWLMFTFILGACFIYMEVSEFIALAHEGFRWDLSAQASSFFTLVGTHGLHVSFGLLWIVIMIIQLPIIGVNHITRRRMTYLGLFWNFLDIVWIFVFTIVYLLGSVGHGAI